MLDSTCELDCHALARDDMQNADTFRQLPQSAQSLLLRLLLRKGPWFRVSSLAYEDVADVDCAVGTLVGAGLLVTATPQPDSNVTLHEPEQPKQAFGFRGAVYFGTGPPQ